MKKHHSAPLPTPGVIVISGDNRNATITQFLHTNRHLTPIYEEYSYCTSTDNTSPDTVDALIALRSPGSDATDVPALNNGELISIPHN